MSSTLAEIVFAAIQLSEEDRLAIVRQLLETMGDEEQLPDIDDDDFIAEIQRRRHDPADAVPWSQLREEN